MTPSPKITTESVILLFADLSAVGQRKPPESWSIADKPKRDAMIRRAASVWVRQLDGWTDHDLRTAADAYAASEYGALWPTPSDLLRLGKQPAAEDTRMWLILRPLLAGSIPVTHVARKYRQALQALPDAHTRRLMSSKELDALRGPFLTACEAPVAAPATTPRQITESAPVQDLSELARSVGQRMDAVVRGGAL